MRPDDRIAWIRGRSNLTAQDVRLLAALASEEGVSYATVMERLWPHAHDRRTRDNLRSVVLKARRRLPEGVTITTLPGTGYRMKGFAEWLSNR